MQRLTRQEMSAGNRHLYTRIARLPACGPWRLEPGIESPLPAKTLDRVRLSPETLNERPAKLSRAPARGDAFEEAETAGCQTDVKTRSGTRSKFENRESVKWISIRN